MVTVSLPTAGISEDMIRVSVGLEGFADIQQDFKLGLKASAKIAAKLGNGGAA